MSKEQSRTWRCHPSSLSSGCYGCSCARPWLADLCCDYNSVLHAVQQCKKFRALRLSLGRADARLAAPPGCQRCTSKANCQRSSLDRRCTAAFQWQLVLPTGSVCCLLASGCTLFEARLPRALLAAAAQPFTASRQVSATGTRYKTNRNAGRGTSSIHTSSSSRPYTYLVVAPAALRCASRRCL